MIGDIIAFDPCDTCENHDMCSRCELTLRRDGALRTDKWISVDERLPGVTGKYICCAEAKNGNAWTMPAFWDLEMKLWFGEFGIIKNLVTHWMPLPEAPKTKGGGE